MTCSVWFLSGSKVVGKGEGQEGRERGSKTERVTVLKVSERRDSNCDQHNAIAIPQKPLLNTHTGANLGSHLWGG